MNISFSTLGCPRWSFQDITATAHDLGFQGIEVHGVGKNVDAPSIPEFSDAALPDTLARLSRLALAIPCLDSDCCLHLPEMEARVDREVQAYIAMAQKLSAPYVRVMGCAAVPAPAGQADEAYVRARLVRLGALAADAGVTLLMETNGVWADTERLARLLREVDNPCVGALWDVHHPYRYMGESPRQSFDHLAPYVRHVHVKDSRMEDGHVRYALPGFGDLPLGEFVQTLRQGGYDGYFSLEWVKRWDMTLEEPGIVFAHYANYIKSF